VQTILRKTDEKARVVLPASFANCQVILICEGDEVRIRKRSSKLVKKYRFRELMAQMKPGNIPATTDDGPIGRELL
jgi:hypothetical protein